MTSVGTKIALTFFTGGLLLAFLGAADDLPSKTAGAKSATSDKKPANKPAGEATSASKKKREYKGMLPQYWKQLGLSKEQTDKVYAAQRAVRANTDPIEDKIEELREQETRLRLQIKELQTQLDAANDNLQKEILALLTPEQKQNLFDLRDQALQKAREKLKAKARELGAEKKDSLPDNKGKKAASAKEN